jgi:hypothetical protein
MIPFDTFICDPDGIICDSAGSPFSVISSVIAGLQKNG